MRVSRLLSETLREVHRDTESGNQELLLRAGFMRQLTAGVYSFLPLGTRVIQKLSQIVREEMNRAGGQEVIMPILQPRDIWEKRPPNGGPNRAEGCGPILFSLKDRKGRDMVLGPTHEELATILSMEFLRSYRDLPKLIYQIQVKERDEPRPRGGLLRGREFLMKDLYSFDADPEGLDISYRKMTAAYSNVFTRCGLRFIIIHADSGAIGGKDSQEFIAITPAGEDDALVCDTCGYAANVERAEFVRPELAHEAELPLEEVYTPNSTTIADLAAFLNIPAARTMKTVCYVSGGRSILAAVRGDLEINEVKLTNVLYRMGINAADLHLASAEELEKTNICAGYTSPLNKDEQYLIIADTSLKSGNNFVAGANKPDYHVSNVNYPRDFRVDKWEDIASAYEGATCANCGGTLHVVHGSEAGHIFKVGTKYSELFGATYQDAEGASHPILMGCYGIGITRLMGIIVEQWHDDHGMVWPFTVAPYHVALVGLDLDKEEYRQQAEQLYTELTAANIEVLYDDRLTTAGVKLNDADLIGLPLRVVISKRSLKNGGVELKLRSEKESRIVPREDAVRILREEIQKGITAIEQAAPKAQDGAPLSHEV